MMTKDEMEELCEELRGLCAPEMVDGQMHLSSGEQTIWKAADEIEAQWLTIDYLQKRAKSELT
jgi:hypothetical protein